MNDTNETSSSSAAAAAASLGDIIRRRFMVRCRVRLEQELGFSTFRSQLVIMEMRNDRNVVVPLNGRVTDCRVCILIRKNVK